MENKKWGLWVLTAFVVGNMVGGGIFMLPANLAKVASPVGSTIAWIATGFGVLMLALVFGNLALRRPDLKAGPQSYAQAMFSSKKVGRAAGYSIAWGYWAANWPGTASGIILFAGYLSTFFPILSSKAVLFTIGSFQVSSGNLTTFLLCSALLWGLQWILASSFTSSGKINFAATAAKLIGFGLFIIFTLSIFNIANASGSTFVDTSGKSIPLFDQINGAAISTLWAFIGIESAVLLSNRAKSQHDVKRATLIGLIISIIIYIAITLLTMGALSQQALRDSQKPLVDALSVAIGPNSASILAVLALISLLGSTVGWIAVSAEVPYQAAKNNLFPTYFAKTNKNGSPVRSLTITNILTQVFLFSTISGTLADAYNFAIVVATLAYLIPYLVSSLYQLKLVITGETYIGEVSSRIKDGIIVSIALIYSLWVIKSGTSDLKTFMLGIGLFLIGLLFYPFIMRNQTKSSI
ncbi:amino acid permease [Ectobacillus polymachus]|uniref:amino acid permease n=1 Tax=Ectobacillus polymachus TaxID=1508806 RepID=UPI003A83DACC